MEYKITKTIKSMYKDIPTKIIGISTINNMDIYATINSIDIISDTPNKIETMATISSNTFIDLSSNTPSKIETISIIPGNTFIDLSWNIPYNGGIDITSYLIRKSTDLSNWVNLSSTTTSFKVTNLLNNIKYYFTVRAINNAGLGPESNVFFEIPKIVEIQSVRSTLSTQQQSSSPKIYVIPTPNIPSKIESITIKSGNTFVDLSWDAPFNGGQNITSYLIQQSTDLSSWFIYGSTTTSTKIINLLNNTKYYFTVQALNSNGFGPESNIVNITTTTKNMLIRYIIGAFIILLIIILIVFVMRRNKLNVNDNLNVNNNNNLNNNLNANNNLNVNNNLNINNDEDDNDDNDDK